MTLQPKYAVRDSTLCYSLLIDRPRQANDSADSASSEVRISKRRSDGLTKPVEAPPSNGGEVAKEEKQPHSAVAVQGK